MQKTPFPFRVKLWDDWPLHTNIVHSHSLQTLGGTHFALSEQHTSKWSKVFFDSSPSNHPTPFFFILHRYGDHPSIRSSQRTFPPPCLFDYNESSPLAYLRAMSTVVACSAPVSLFKEQCLWAIHIYCPSQGQFGGRAWYNSTHGVQSIAYLWTTHRTAMTNSAKTMTAI